MKYLLDSNVIIKLVMGLDEAIVARAAECDAGDMVTSAIAFAEVAYGSLQALPPPLEQMQAFVEEVPVLDFDYSEYHYLKHIPLETRFANGVTSASITEYI